MKSRAIHGLILLMFFFAFSVSGFAQSGSYLDTIYRAGNQGSAAVTDEDTVNYVNEDEGPEVVDVPEPTGIPAQQEALNRLQNIVNNIMRILTGKMCGAKITIIVIPCERIVPKPTGTSTGTSTSTATSTSTSTSTATSTSTSTSTATSTSTSTSTGTSTSTSTATSTSTSTSTATSTSTSTSTSTGTKPDDVEGMRTYINGKYNINCADGQGATWSINQINAADETFASLPSFFRDATQTVLRDGPPPSFAPASALGYVIVPQRTIHLLDLSTKMTQGLYNSLVSAYGRAPTVEEQMYALKRNFQGTLVHEMTHCFQNTYPQIYNAWKSTFNNASSPTSYGKTQPAEDMAESVRVYWSGGSIRNGQFVSNSGVVMDMQRYEFIKNYVMKGKEFLN